MNIYIASAIIAILVVGYLYRSKQAKNKVIRVIDDNCTGCGRCMKRCRRNALEISNDGTKKQVVVKYPEKCTACSDCVAVCKFKALVLENRK